MESLWQDLRYAVRGLAKSPGFTAVAVLTLALGIGANTVIFTVVDGALLRGLPYRDPGRIVHVWEGTSQESARQFSYLDYLDVRDRTRTFSDVAAYGFYGAALEAPGGGVLLGGGRVSANFFETLGVQPLLGRTFRADEDQVGRPRDAVILTYETWQSRFGGDPGVIGRSIRLTGQPFTVIGITPRGFHFAPLRDPEIFVTLSPGAELAARRQSHFMWTIARLKPATTLEQANADLRTIAEQRAKEDPRWHKDTSMNAQPLREAIIGDVRPLVLGLLGAVSVVLLIACVNVANMLLARSTGRLREVGIRIALGASRGRLVKQFLAESVLLSLLGGAAALLWAGWGLRVMIAAIPASQLARFPFLQGLGLHWGVLSFTFGVCLLTGVLFGLAPALRSTQGAIAERVKDGGRSATARGGLRGLLVVVEVAMALVLVTAAGLLGRSVFNLMNANSGFDTKNLLTARTDVSPQRFDTPEKLQGFFSQLEARVSALPGVRGVAFVDRLPLVGGSGNTGTPSIVGRPDSTGETLGVQMRTISCGYFRVMGIPLIGGRTFAETDRAGAPLVVAVNQSFVNHFFPNEEALGQRLTFSFMAGTPPLEIVGVVRDENVGDLGATPTPVLYFPMAQDGSPSMNMIVRTEMDPRALAAALPSEIRAVEPAALLRNVRTLEAVIAVSPAAFSRRYPLMLLGSFAFVGLVLACVGLYGVMACTVTQRTAEMGIRMAIGAQPSDVLKLVLKQGMGLALVGVALGCLGAFAITPLLGRLLFRTGAADPLTFAGAALTLTLVALLACVIPARRAARVDPLVALRHE